MAFISDLLDFQGGPERALEVMATAWQPAVDFSLTVEFDRRQTHAIGLCERQRCSAPGAPRWKFRD